MENFQKCNKCNTEKSLDSFCKNKKNRTGRSYTCRVCVKNGRKRPPKEKEILLENQKRCNHCKIVREKFLFCRNKNFEDELNRSCKICEKEFARLRLLKPKKILLFKKCNVCQIVKDIQFFDKKINTSDGYSTICKICRKPVSKKYNFENKEKISEDQKNYRIKNKEYFRVSHREYLQKRCKVDPLFKFNKNIRALVLITFKNSKLGTDTKKPVKTECILGCKIGDFTNIIQNLFSDWMTWENRGRIAEGFKNGWDLDHIIPVSVAKTKDEVILLNHWSNFQPLCSKENRNIKKNNVYPLCNTILKISVDENGVITKL